MISEFDVSVLLISLMKKHNLHSWDYSFLDTIAVGGWTEYYKETDTGTIFISKQFIDSDKITREDLVDLILHEIAHAIDKCKNGHGKEWLSISKQIGHSGSVTCAHFYDNTKYHLSCVNGCIKYRQLKSKKRHYCNNHKIRMKYLLNNCYTKKIKKIYNKHSVKRT